MIQQFLVQSDSPLVVTPETRLTDLGISSLNHVQFVVQLESAFDFEFEDDEMDFHSFDTLEDLAQYIGRKAECRVVA